MCVGFFFSGLVFRCGIIYNFFPNICQFGEIKICTYDVMYIATCLYAQFTTDNSIKKVHYITINTYLAYFIGLCC